MSEADIRQMARTMHHGGCSPHQISVVVARCAVTLGHQEALETRLTLSEAERHARERAESLVQSLTQEGWLG